MDTLDATETTENETYVEEDTSIVDEVYADLPDDSGDVFASVIVSMDVIND